MNRFGRDNFTEATKISGRANPSEVDWKNFGYMAFDLPNHKGTYAERYSALGTPYTHLPLFSPSLILIPLFLEENIRHHMKGTKYLKVAPKEICKDTQHLEKFLQDVIDKGGEGIILRDPAGLYTPGRSQGFLKHKVIGSLSFFVLMMSFSEIQGCRSANHRLCRSSPMGMQIVPPPQIHKSKDLLCFA